MNIYLIGMMGSGKSRVGRLLAARMDRQWLDLDHVIEERTGESIEQIFDIHGEAHFRYLEEEAMNELLSMKNRVVSTGGGTPCTADLMVKMNSSGLTIYLRTPVDVLVQRLQKDEKVRPLLADLTTMQMSDTVSTILGKRKAIYETANLTVNAGGSSEEVVLAIRQYVDSL